MRFRHRRILLLIALCIACTVVFHNLRLLKSTSQVPSSIYNPVPPLDSADNTVLKDGKPSNKADVPPAIYIKRLPGNLCPKLTRPINVQDLRVFQKLDEIGSDTYVFSAFLDAAQNLVRVIGLDTGGSKSLVCHLWYDSDTSDLHVTNAQMSYLQEGHGRRYTATYFECPLPDSRRPYAVSMALRECALADFANFTNLLPVLQARGPTNDFTLCVTALNFKYSRAYELVEMLELNRMLGADKFTFYVHSIGSNVESVLRWYAEKGLVELIDWKLPMNVDHWPPIPGVEPEVHYFAQLASHNDCLNRNRNTSRYLVYEDVDEFIIPKRHRKWADMLADITLQTGKNMSAYIVASVFFRKDWPSNDEDYPGKALAVKYRSIVLATDKREQQVFPHSQRAKYIVDPKAVQVVGIHNIWNFRGTDDTYQVPHEHALLHHYRNWEQPNDVFKAVRDTDIYRFKDELLSRLEERWRELPQVPLDIPIDTYGTVNEPRIATHVSAVKH